MTSIYQVCLSRPAIERCFNRLARACSGLLLLSVAVACTEQPNATTEPAGNVIPAIGEVTQQTAPMSLKVQLDLAGVREQVAPDAKVFVFVREPGQRMPLGVEQFTVATLPPVVEFHTTNNYSVVSAIARISPSGRVEKSPGDFEVSAATSFAHPATVVNLAFGGSSASGSAAVGAAPAEAVQPAAVTVNLSMDLPAGEAEKLSEHARVFVIAKAPGSPIPVAVKAFAVNAVPEQLVLTDADAMMPTRTLSTVPKIELSARISQSGDVSRDPGDWEGFAADPSSGAPATYQISINKRVE